MASLTSREITDWLAFGELEPFGPLAEEYRAGVIAAAVLNSAFGRGKGARVVKPSDLFPSLRSRSKNQPWQAMAETLKGMTRAMGGKVTERGEQQQSEQKQGERQRQGEKKQTEKSPAKSADQKKTKDKGKGNSKGEKK